MWAGIALDNHPPAAHPAAELRTGIADDANCAVSQPLGHPIESHAAAIESNVSDFASGKTEDVANCRRAFRLAEPYPLDVRPGQPGESMWRQRREVQTLRGFRYECEGQSFQTSRSFSG